MMNDIDLLVTIEKELNDLCKLSTVVGLTESDVRKMNMLIKSRQLLMGKPTEIMDDLDIAMQKEIDNLSPDELTQMIQEELFGERVVHIRKKDGRKE